MQVPAFAINGAGLNIRNLSGTLPSNNGKVYRE